MKIEINIESDTALILALESFCEKSKIVLKEPIDREELALNLVELVKDTDLRINWIKKKFPDIKVVTE